MKARDMLADGSDNRNFGGIDVRKGTVAAFLANVRVLADAAPGSVARTDAERDILEALPALRALGLFDILEVRNERVRAFIDGHA